MPSWIRLESVFCQTWLLYRITHNNKREIFKKFKFSSQVNCSIVLRSLNISSYVWWIPTRSYGPEVWNQKLWPITIYFILDPFCLPCKTHKVVIVSFCQFGDLFKSVFISLYNGHLWLWWAPVKSKLIINLGITKPKIINR